MKVVLQVWEGAMKRLARVSILAISLVSQSAAAGTCAFGGYLGPKIMVRHTGQQVCVAPAQRP
jgi:hypothetical protein